MKENGKGEEGVVWREGGRKEGKRVSRGRKQVNGGRREEARERLMKEQRRR